jgi:hypothetical protein
LLVAHWQTPVGAGDVVVKSRAASVAVPASIVVPVHGWPVIVVWVIVSVPVISAPIAKLSSPVGPLADVQVPVTFVPFCVRVAVTASVTVTPPVTNRQVPVQAPPTSMRLGDMSESQPAPASAHAAAIRTGQRPKAEGRSPPDCFSDHRENRLEIAQMPRP